MNLTLNLQGECKRYSNANSFLEAKCKNQVAGEIGSGNVVLKSRHGEVYSWHLQNEMCKAFSAIYHTEVCRLIGVVFSCEAFSPFESCDVFQCCSSENTFSGIPEHQTQKQEEL